MAATSKLATNDQGIIQQGRFAGYHIDDVLEFAERADVAASAENTPPAGAQPPVSPPARPSGDPSARLADDASRRVDKTTELLAQQYEQADEAEFAASVTDYDQPVPGLTPAQTYRQAIAFLKGTYAPEARVQKGIHRRLYVLIKMEKDPQFTNRVFSAPPPVTPPPAEPDETPDEVNPTLEPPTEEDPTTPPPITQPPPPATPLKPKPVPPPSAPPTPGNRAAVPGQQPKKSRLKPNDKIRSWCSHTGIPLEDYMLRLEERGMTQADIDAASSRQSARVAAGRKSVYDHVDE